MKFFVDPVDITDDPLTVRILYPKLWLGPTVAVSAVLFFTSKLGGMDEPMVEYASYIGLAISLAVWIGEKYNARKLKPLECKAFFWHEVSRGVLHEVAQTDEETPRTLHRRKVKLANSELKEWPNGRVDVRPLGLIGKTIVLNASDFRSDDERIAFIKFARGMGARLDDPRQELLDRICLETGECKRISLTDQFFGPGKDVTEEVNETLTGYFATSTKTWCGIGVFVAAMMTLYYFYRWEPLLSGSICGVILAAGKHLQTWRAKHKRSDTRYIRKYTVEDRSLKCWCEPSITFGRGIFSTTLDHKLEIEVGEEDLLLKRYIEMRVPYEAFVDMDAVHEFLQYCEDRGALIVRKEQEVEA